MLRLPSPDPPPTCSSCLETLDLRFLEPEEGFEPSTFRLRVGCSQPAWTAADGSSRLTLDASSVLMALEGSRRMDWMINEMIKVHATAHSRSGPAGANVAGV